MKKEQIERLQKLSAKNSAFLFGPRMTGKTTLLSSLKPDLFLDLLDPTLELGYKANPKLFWEEISVLPDNSFIIIDEIQKVPTLLNYVQMGIDRHNFSFILSGSSARKLKRGFANLLGGRALDLRMHPFTSLELKEKFDIKMAIEKGTLPKIYNTLLYDTEKSAISFLNSYVTTYIKEEIQAEALTRNLGAFQRFLKVVAFCNAQTIEFSNISRECSVPASTVKEYFQIIEDTLLGFFLWPYDRTERKKARPKFYFFDTGVLRALQNRLNDPPTPSELGFLFETWLIGEFRRLNDIYERNHEFSFWRNKNHEVDLLISKGNKHLLAIEIKSGVINIKNDMISDFHKKFKDVPLVVASLPSIRKRKSEKLDVLPWKNILKMYLKL